MKIFLVVIILSGWDHSFKSSTILGEYNNMDKCLEATVVLEEKVPDYTEYACIENAREIKDE